MNRLLRYGICCLVMFVFAGPGNTVAQTSEAWPMNVGTQYERVQVVEVASPFEHPWSVAFLPDGSMLVTERPGRLKHVRDGDVIEVDGLPGDIVSLNQGGLLDVAVHPDYEDNGWIYMTYSRGTHSATATALIRARLSDDQLVDVEHVFTQDRRSSPGRHYGSRIAFMHDGTVLMSVGDRGVEPGRAQDLGDHAGSIIRVHADGSVPDDNPFVDREDARDEIYSYGHRNVQGLLVHPETGEVWAHEHGPRGGDELNRIEPGENYGWPVVSLGRDYRTQEQWGEARSHPRMKAPVFEFIPHISPSGLAVNTGGNFPNWEGDFFVGGLSGRVLQRLVIEDWDGPAVVHAEEILKGDEIGRVRDVRFGPDGNLYLLNDAADATLYRIEPR